MKTLLKMETSAIYQQDDGTLLWLSATGEEDTFDDVSDLLNYAEECEPQYYSTLKHILEEDLK